MTTTDVYVVYLNRYNIIYKPGCYNIIYKLGSWMVGLVGFSNGWVYVVLTSTHRYNAVRGHRTGSNNSGAEDYLRRKNKKNQKILHTISETNAYTSDKSKTVRSAYVRINIHIIC